MERFPLYLLLLLLPCLQASDCPDEWYDTGSPDLGCLFFGDKPKTWVEAHEACEDNIGHMAEAATLEQANEIYTLAKIIGDIRGVKRWWLGLTDIIKEGDWHWANSYESGSVQVSDFATIWTPNDAADNLDDCVVMKDGGTLSWADINCDKSATEDGGSTQDIQVLCQCVGEECSKPTPEPTQEPTPTPVTCDAGWIVNEGLGCIKPLAETADASTAAKAALACKTVNGGAADGFLVEPQDACKEAALKDFLKYPLSKDLWWIGLEWDGTAKQWAWTSGATYDETEADWGPGAGQFPELLNCVAIENRDGFRQWYNRPCSSDPTPLTGGGICVQDTAYKCVEAAGSTSPTAQGETTVTATATPTPGTGTTTEPRGCKHNPSEANGPCYLVKDDAKSFQEAESYCSSLGGHLASAHSASENIYIGSLLSASSRPYWWIGAQCGDGTACTSNDSWAWTDGSTWGDYENWVAGETSQKPCAFYERSSKNWRSWSCASTFPFVCKI
jgi:hypothetical protein